VRDDSRAGLSLFLDLFVGFTSFSCENFVSTLSCDYRLRRARESVITIVGRACIARHHRLRLPLLLLPDPVIAWSSKSFTLHTPSRLGIGLVGWTHVLRPGQGLGVRHPGR